MGTPASPPLSKGQKADSETGGEMRVPVVQIVALYIYLQRAAVLKSIGLKEQSPAEEGVGSFVNEIY